MEKESLKTDSSSVEFLKSLRKSRLSEGKVVVALCEEFQILGLGSTEELHFTIITRTSEELLPGKAVATWPGRKGNPMPTSGILIGGAYFKVENWEKPTVKVYGTSTHFGDLPDWFLEDPIEDVVRETIENLVKLATG